MIDPRGSKRFSIEPTGERRRESRLRGLVGLLTCGVCIVLTGGTWQPTTRSVMRPQLPIANVFVPAFDGLTGGLSYVVPGTMPPSESQWSGTLNVPRFFDGNFDPFAGRGSMMYVRQPLYADALYDLLLMFDSRRAVENAAALAAPATIVAKAFSVPADLGKVLSKTRALDGTSRLAKQVGEKFSWAASTASVLGAAQAGYWNGLEIVAAMQAYRGTRAELLADLLSSRKDLDPEIDRAMKEAVRRIDADLQVERDNFVIARVAQSAGAAGAQAASGKIAGSLLGSALGAAGIGGALGAGIGIALPAAAAASLSRTYEREKIPVMLTLLTTLDVQVLEPAWNERSSLRPDDQLALLDLREHLSLMTVRLAEAWWNLRYRTTLQSVPQNSGLAYAKRWADGHPHFDASFRASIAAPGLTVDLPTTGSGGPSIERTLIMMDVSESMLEPLQGGSGTRLEAAKAAARSAMAALPATVEVGVATFGERCRVSTVVPFTRDRQQVSGAIDGWRAEGNTPLVSALRTAAAEVRNSPHPDRVSVVVVTDGMETCGSEGAVEAAARELGVALRIMR